MASNNESNDVGKFARHPLRTMSGALIAGTGLGAGLMHAKHQRNKSSLQKFIDRFGDKIPK
jgi:hypothetical protein